MFFLKKPSLVSYKFHILNNKYLDCHVRVLSRKHYNTNFDKKFALVYVVANVRKGRPEVNHPVSR